MKESLLRFTAWVIGACRIGVGLLVINTGYELTQKRGSFMFWGSNSSIDGAFVILLGLVLVALAFFPNSSNKSD